MELPPLSLYVHLPWCERKCPYCDFNSHEATELPEEMYIEALLDDLENDASLAADRPVQTLFIGGGTPSLFNPKSISRLVAGIGQRLVLAPDLEATMEANPGSAEAGKFQGFREAGINRLSLGIQSFDDDRLRALGRIHNSDQARAAIGHARDAGFDNFNLDLMHGLPGQTPAGASADLAEALGYQAPHLSWYQLTIETNTVFNKHPPPLPVEDILADIQETGEALLADAGMQQYEVSAYSLPGRQCRHNLNYWSFGDYLAIGAGAHGKITGADGQVRRYAKTRAPGDYLDGRRTGFTASSRILDRREIVEEFMLFALRLNKGFGEADFEERTGVSIGSLQPRLDQLIDRGLLENAGSRVRATDLGRRFLDTVIAEFLA